MPTLHKTNLPQKITGKLPSVENLLEHAVVHSGEETYPLLFPHRKRLSLLLEEATQENTPVCPGTFVALADFLLEVAKWANLRECFINLCPEGTFSVAWGYMLSRRVSIEFQADGGIGCTLLEDSGKSHFCKSKTFSNHKEVLEYLDATGYSEVLEQ